MAHGPMVPPPQPMHDPPHPPTSPRPAPVKDAHRPVLRPGQHVGVIRGEARADVVGPVVAVPDDEALQLQVGRLEDERQARARRHEDLLPVGAEGELRPRREGELLRRLVLLSPSFGLFGLVSKG